MQILGESTVLNNDGLARLGVYIRSWCPGDPQQLELIYRGSRDGFRAAAFHAKCTEKNPSTITLVKVDHGGRDRGSIFVGGFSSVSWAQTSGHQNATPPGAFIFAQGEDEFEPILWALPKGPKAHPMVRYGSSLGPDFGVGGYRVEFDPQGRNICKFILGDENVSTSPSSYSGEEKTVSEVEFYSVYVKASVQASDDLSSAKGGRTADGTCGYSTAMDACQIENTRLFGASIAGALMEEGIALQDAQSELTFAGKRVRAAACALTAMYGPDVATGKHDPVVELNVRGTRMTTVLST
ncbi:unnamed protein product [Ascophyllum nodosum]